MTLVAFTFSILLAAVLLHFSSASIDLRAEREAHTFADPGRRSTYRELAGRSNLNILRNYILRPMLIERVPGTYGNAVAQQILVHWMRDLLGWHVEEDSFVAETPHNATRFTNIIARLNPNASRFLTFACHFDTKYFKDSTFVGATDSAVPCSMMIDVARSINQSLHDSVANSDVSLQYIFFDGEEAFVEWSAADSLYGSRHLAEKWHLTPHPHNAESTVLDSIDAFLLLDLIGAKNPRFLSFFPQTDSLFQRLAFIESRLHMLRRLQKHSLPNEYFLTGGHYLGQSNIQDDHIPFLLRGVPVLHMIALPFPEVWHTAADNESALHYRTINNLGKILRVFVFEYLHLSL